MGAKYSQVTKKYRRAMIHCVGVIFFCNPLITQPAQAEEAATKSTKTNVAAAATPAVIGQQPALSEVTNFKSQPLAILSRFPDAGAAMASFVAQLVTKEPNVIDAVLSVVHDTSPEQATAMGAGLVRAARVLAKNSPDLVRSLVDKIHQSENKWLITTFEALGYNYKITLRYVNPALIPPAEHTNLQAGSELPPTKSRLGSLEHPIMYKTDTVQPFKRAEIQEYGPDGTIIALLAIDARSSGAVSTSPTN